MNTSQTKSGFPVKEIADTMQAYSSVLNLLVDYVVSREQAPEGQVSNHNKAVLINALKAQAELLVQKSMGMVAPFTIVGELVPALLNLIPSQSLPDDIRTQLVDIVTENTNYMVENRVNALRRAEELKNLTDSIKGFAAEVKEREDFVRKTAGRLSQDTGVMVQDIAIQKQLADALLMSVQAQAVARE